MLIIICAAAAACRIVVSAPNGTANSANAEPHTGVLYLCSVTMAPNNGECEPLTGDRSGADNRLYDTQGAVLINIPAIPL